MKSSLLAIIISITLTGCINTPPHYERIAGAFLQSKGESKETIEKLTTRSPLTAEEAERLVTYDNISVLNLLGSNPGTPYPILEKLSKHGCFEVRTGVASNRKAPLELLLSLRTKNKSTTVNTILVMNPQIPKEILQEMYDNKETTLCFFVGNPNCPEAIMRFAATKGDGFDRRCLVENPNLPVDLFELLKNDPDPSTRVNLGANPKIPRHILEELKNDPNEIVRRDLRNVKYQNKD